MNEKIKYDPEDLESLLTNKAFEELYPEERSFVLKHLDSAEEYASLRATLHAVLDSNDSVKDISPRLETKDLLLQEFDVEEKAGYKIWLNSLFASWNIEARPWYQNQGMQLGFATVVIILIASFFYFNGGEEQQLIAENISQKEKQELVSEKEIKRVENSEFEKSVPEVDVERSESIVEDLSSTKTSVDAIEDDQSYTLDSDLIADDEDGFRTKALIMEDNVASTFSTSENEVNATALYDANQLTYSQTDESFDLSPTVAAGAELSLDSSVLINTENLSDMDFIAGNAIEKEEMTSVTLSTISLEKDKNSKKDILVSRKASLNDYSNLLDLLYTAP